MSGGGGAAARRCVVGRRAVIRRPLPVADLFAADFAEKHIAHKAALTGDVAALRQVLGPEPKAIASGVKGSADEPLLADALEHPEILRALLEMGFDPDETGASGRTPLMVAARLDLSKQPAFWWRMAPQPDRGASDAVAQTDIGGDALCMLGQTTAADTPGRTALSYSAELGSPEMVRLPLDHGAAAAKLDSAGRLPLDYVRNRGDSDQADRIAEMLR